MYGQTVTREMPKGGDKMAVTKEDFDDYESIRKEGLYNMLSSDAILMSGLDKSTYMQIISNYSELKEKFD